MRVPAPVIFMFTLAACSLTPEQIAVGIDECNYYGLEPVVIVRRDSVKSINCVPDEENGYTIIDKELDLISIPELPLRPYRVP